MPHAAVAKQRMSAVLHGIRLERTVDAQGLACGSEQGEQHDAKGAHETEAVMALGAVEAQAADLSNLRLWIAPTQAPSLNHFRGLDADHGGNVIRVCGHLGTAQGFRLIPAYPRLGRALHPSGIGVNVVPQADDIVKREFLHRVGEERLIPKAPPSQDRDCTDVIPSA